MIQSSIFCKNFKFSILVLATLGLCSPAQSQDTKPDQLLFDISSYYNSTKTMQGDFLQFGPNGERTQGKFYISRPGKLRFQYANPARINIVSNGRVLAIIDRKLKTQELYPLKKTPLAFFVAREINLAKLVKLEDVIVDEKLTQMSFVHESPFGDSKIALYFNTKTFELRQWTVTDSQGHDTSVSLFNVILGKPIGKHLFRVNRRLNTENYR